MSAVSELASLSAPARRASTSSWVLALPRAVISLFLMAAMAIAAWAPADESSAPALACPKVADCSALMTSA